MDTSFESGVIPMQLDNWLDVLKSCVPIFVAIVGIVPTVIANRKKTQSSLTEMQNQIVEDINATKTAVKNVQTRLDEHLEEEEEHRAKQCRYRFLRFYDEVCEGVEHSESHWEDVLDDADFYENYCEHHKDFKNSRGKIAIEYLRETYAKLKKTGKFLTHVEGD